MCLRESASNIESVQTCGESGRIERCDGHQLSPGALQLLKIFRIVESERGIPKVSNSETARIWQSWALVCARCECRGTASDGQQRIEVHTILHPLEKIALYAAHGLELIRRNETQMTLGKGILLKTRQRADDRNVANRFDGFTENVLVALAVDLIQHHALNRGARVECLATQDERRSRACHLRRVEY